jgi:hypothetical protein
MGVVPMLGERVFENFDSHRAFARCEFSFCVCRAYEHWQDANATVWTGGGELIESALCVVRALC